MKVIIYVFDNHNPKISLVIVLFWLGKPTLTELNDAYEREKVYFLGGIRAGFYLIIRILSRSFLNRV